jgi:hypothetical protein
VFFGAAIFSPDFADGMNAAPRLIASSTEVAGIETPRSDSTCSRVRSVESASIVAFTTFFGLLEP